MYVNDIVMGCQRNGPWNRITANVWIKDDTGANVDAATVYVEWTGDVPGTDSGTTGPDGTVDFSSGKSRSTITGMCCVTNVVKAGYVYNPALNNKTCDINTCP